MKSDLQNICEILNENQNKNLRDYIPRLEMNDKGQELISIEIESIEIAFCFTDGKLVDICKNKMFLFRS